MKAETSSLCILSLISEKIFHGLFLLPTLLSPPVENPTVASDTKPSLPLLSRSLSALQTFPPSPDCLIAIGDLEKFKQALQLTSLIEGSNCWIGGSAMVVQIGDVLDRGGEELKILYFLEKLKREAARSGGSIIIMHGNHEIMNVEGNFMFVTETALNEFRVWVD